MINVKKVLLIVAVILFVLVGVGKDTFTFGTVTLQFVGFGLGCFALSFLVP